MKQILKIYKCKCVNIHLELEMMSLEHLSLIWLYNNNNIKASKCKNGIRFCGRLIKHKIIEIPPQRNQIEIH